MDLFGIPVGNNRPIFLIAGPCAIESYEIALRTAEHLGKISKKYGILTIYKSSFCKANRTAWNSFRGLGIDEGLKILSAVRNHTGLPITTDIHLPNQVAPVAEVVDLIQIPAFLARQSDLIELAAGCHRPVHIKKPQFMSPQDVYYLKEKAEQAGKYSGKNPDKFLFGERGSCFGNNDLVVDMRSLKILSDMGCNVVIDASHSTSFSPSHLKNHLKYSEFTPVIARSAVAVGVAGVFIETHPSPNTALSDGNNQYELAGMDELVGGLSKIDRTIKKFDL